MPSHSMLQVGIRPASFVGSGTSFDEMVEWVVRAEERGFDSVHFGDRMLAEAPPAYGSTAAEVTVALSTFAARTEEMDLGPLIWVVPYRHPIQTAKILGTLDMVSDGRLIMGVGTGWQPHEFRSLDVPKSERGQRLEEGVEIVKRLWTDDHVDYSGESYAIEDVTVAPKPVQEPHPPVWFASFSPHGKEFTPIVDRVLERVGRLGDGWVPLTYSADSKEMVTPDQLGTAWERIAAGAEKHDRNPDDIEIVISVWPFLMEDEAAERERCHDAVSVWFDGSYEEAKATYPIGTTEEVFETLREMASQLPRVDRFIFTPFNYDHEQMDRIADDLRPMLRREFG